MKFFNDKAMLEDADIRCIFDKMECFLEVKNAPYGMSKEENIIRE